MQACPLYELADLRQVEARADAAGVRLMERAARATANWLLKRQAERVLIAAGPGNNGGDALWAAAFLHDVGVTVDIWLPQPPASEQAKQALAALEQRGLKPFTALPADYPPPDWAVDGLFGIGLARALAAPWDQVVCTLNALEAPILALDTPSGLNAYTGRAYEPTVRASATLTFLCHKPGLLTADGPDMAGDIILADLNVPADWWPPQAASVYAPPSGLLQRPRNSHKGSYGTVAVVGGAPGMLGAALLAGRSALAAGAGKVYVCPLDDRLPVDPAAPELMVYQLDDTGRLPSCDVVALGPGLGRGSAAHMLLPQTLQLELPLVLDADALNLVAESPPLATRLSERSGASVLTPHPAEAARLLGVETGAVQADRVAAVRELARRFNAVVVLKGVGSLIARPDGYYCLNTSGGPALAAAGQGDVLSGAIAALLAQGLSAFDAACCAVWAHGTAGDDYTHEADGPIGLLASAGIARLSRVLNRLTSCA
jgi:hydroxyethylthiazole kinase-like uncharacterized protein yjeF